MNVEFDFSGTTAIVTGGGRGIGEEIARAIGAAGANTVVAARTAAEIEATVSAIESAGGTAAAVEADLRSAADVDRVVDETLDRFGPAAVLVNNAGTNVQADLLERTVEDVDTMIDVNLRAVYLLSRRFAEEYVEAGLDRGRIVNIASIHATQGIPRRVVYSGTKSGVYGLTRGFAASLARNGVTVNSVSPGMIDVERVSESLGTEVDDKHVEEIPVGRLGTTGDVAGVCLFLLSDLADYVTGADVVVDGGVTFTRRPYHATYGTGLEG